MIIREISDEMKAVKLIAPTPIPVHPPIKKLTIKTITLSIPTIRGTTYFRVEFFLPIIYDSMIKIVIMIIEIMYKISIINLLLVYDIHIIIIF